MPEIPQTNSDGPYFGPQNLAIKLFDAQYPNASFNSLDEFQKAREAIAGQADPDGMWYLEDFLYSYYGVEVLPATYPQIQRTHFAIDYQNRTAESVSPDDRLYLPKTLDGVSFARIVNSTADFMSEQAVGWVEQWGMTTASRQDLASGRCHLSVPLIGRLKSLYPSISEKIHHLRIPAAARRDSYPLYLYPLSYGHSIVGIEYTGDEPMMLQIDPTIAQVDLTEEYDIEVTAIPMRNYRDFLNLRYRTNPQIEIGMS